MTLVKRVLIVDENEQSRAKLKTFFTNNNAHSFYVQEVPSARNALEKCREGAQDLIVLASSVQDLTFSDFASAFKKQNSTGMIVYVANSKEDGKVLEALHLGAKDCILREELSQNYFIHRINQIIEKDSLSQKVSRQASELEELMIVDPLTSLPNREYCIQTLKQTIAQAQRNNRLFCLLLFNIDNFKRVNENFSHEMGDSLLKEFAKRLKHTPRAEDVVVRMWGDEFIVILTEIKEVFDAGIAGKKIMQEINRPFMIGTKEIMITASVGVACFPIAGLDSTLLLKNAATAMRRVKEEGGNKCQFFQPDLQDHYMQRVMLENEMLFALERNEIFLRYQPKIDLHTNAIIGMEAFIRWSHPKLGEIGPDKFIKIAENNGQIVPIGNWVIESACEQFAKWLPLMNPGVHLCLNISMRQLEYERLPEIVGKALSMHHLSPSQLEIDLPEISLSTQSSVIQTNIKHLHDMGLYIIIENFGTGLIGFRNLKNAPFSALKIDRTFIKELKTNLSDAAVVKSLISLGNGLGINVIAEGVEEEYQKEFLLKNNCSQAQGFLFSKPLEVAEMQSLLEKSKK